jgi:hypothetical protein
MRKLLISFIIVIISLPLFSQEKSLEEVMRRGLIYRLDDEGPRFVKIGFGLQAWARYMEYNPGTLDYQGEPIGEGYDMSLRRTFISMAGMFDRFTFFTLLAMDSQTPEVILGPFGKKKPEFFFYDTWMSYDIIPKHMSFGFGLNMFNGVSRYASASSSRTLAADPIVIGVPNLITTEQLGRQMSFFLSGQFGIFDFRLALAKPFIADTRPILYVPGTYEFPNTNPSVKGYFTFQLFDKEDYKFPFKNSSYLGNGRYFNIGLGFDYHPKSTITYLPLGEQINNRLHLGLDIFYDVPVGDLSALTVYLGAFYFDYGEDYMLSYGVMNPFPGAISQIQQGTGTALHLEAGYVLPFRIMNEHKIQPFIQLTYRNFEAANEPNIHYNTGVNYYFADHHIKTTLQWEYRPIWRESQSKYDYFSSIVMRAQLFF